MPPTLLSLCVEVLLAEMVELEELVNLIILVTLVAMVLAEKAEQVTYSVEAMLEAEEEVMLEVLLQPDRLSAQHGHIQEQAELALTVPEVAQAIVILEVPRQVGAALQVAEVIMVTDTAAELFILLLEEILQ